MVNVLLYMVSSRSSFSILRCCKTLESEISKIDAAYDSLNEAWTEGEVTGFEQEKLLDLELGKARKLVSLNVAFIIHLQLSAKETTLSGYIQTQIYI